MLPSPLHHLQPCSSLRSSRNRSLHARSADCQRHAHQARQAASGTTPAIADRRPHKAHRRPIGRLRRNSPAVPPAHSGRRCRRSGPRVLGRRSRPAPVTAARQVAGSNRAATASRCRQALAAIGLLAVRNLVRHVGGRRAASRAEREDVDLGESNLAHHVGTWLRKSASLSPGKPTMTSVVNAGQGSRSCTAGTDPRTSAWPSVAASAAGSDPIRSAGRCESGDRPCRGIRPRSPPARE